MSLNFKTFLTLSVAVHAAVLFTWVAPVPDAGLTGQALLLDITANTDQAVSLPVTNTGSNRREAATMAGQQASPQRAALTTHDTISEKASVANTQSANTRELINTGADTGKTGTTASLVASSPRPDHQESERNLRDSVLKLVTQRLSYPAIARRKGWQGVVTLELHIEADGLISDLQINKTSGYPTLDRAAMNSLQMASIPGAGQWLRGRSIDMLIPVEYRLLDS